MNSSIDITGARVEQYAKIVLFYHEMKMLHHIIPFWCTKFQFQNEDNYELMIELRIIDRLRPLNQISMYDLPSGWTIEVGDSFQTNSTNIWINVGNITEASWNLQSAVLYRTLLLCYLFVAYWYPLIQKAQLVKYAIFDWPMIKNKWLMLVGDGLN